jgi:hypothetical protein
MFYLCSICTEIDLSVPENMMTVYFYTSLYFANEVQYARNGSLGEVCNTLIAGQDTPLDTMARMVRRAFFPMCLVANAEAILTFFHNVDSFKFELR